MKSKFSSLIPLIVAIILSGTSVAAVEPKPVVAVFDIAADGITLDPEIQRRLTRYLGVRLMMDGRYQVIPEGQLKEAMVALKIESQKDCYDEMCRVKLGNEAAANKNLNVSVWKVGNKCSIIGAMYDLRAAASEQATEVKNVNCDEEGLKSGIERFAMQLGKAGESRMGGFVSGGHSGGGPSLPPPPEQADQVEPENAEQLPPVKEETGYLSVEGTPRGARVDISGPRGFGTDGSLATSLPVRPFPVPAGNYRVAVSLAGYEMLEQSARVYADGTQVVRADLVKSTGEIQISGTPDGARCNLSCPNGFTRDFGLPASQWTVSVPRGTCRLVVERDGYAKYDESFDVPGGETVTRTVELARNAPQPGTSGAGWNSPVGGNGGRWMGEKVGFTLHVMSQCPFGAQVQKGIAGALKTLGASVDFNMQYIGDEPNPGDLTSMHGASEVQGDKYQMCTMRYAPQNYMDVIVCMANDIKNIPDNFNECARAAGVDAASIRRCAEGHEGTKLLSASFAASKLAGARGSPTMFMNGEKYQGGRNEMDFLRAICGAFKGPSPAPCADIPEPMKIPVSIIADQRCTNCYPDRILGQLKNMFPGLVAETYDYTTREGRGLYESLTDDGLKLLPAFLFDSVVERDPGYDQIKRFIVDAGPYKLLQVGAKFDPTAEICDNAVDDDGDGIVDCNDRDCAGKTECRREIPRRLDLFVMSQCPFGVKAQNALPEVIQAFRRDNIEIKINYIAEQLSDGSFKALHGQPEVEENIRALCAAKYYRKGYKYLDYIICRNQDIRSEDWSSCAVDGISAAVISRCSTGGEGARLLAENVKLARELDIGASPTWLANNKYRFAGITAEAIITGMCEHNARLKGCPK